MSYAPSVQYSTTARSVQEMFSAIAPRYDLANSVLSAGIHHWWRRYFVRLIPRELSSPRLILDLCTGTGVLLPLLRERGGTVLGSDFCLPMLQASPADRRAVFPLFQGDALRLPLADGSIDIVTVAFGVRNFENTEQGLRELRRVMHPEGGVFVLEFGQPRGLVAPFFSFYSRYIMPRIGSLITGNRAAYEYLPETSSRFPCGEVFLSIAARAGFTHTRAHSLTGGICYAYELRVGAPR